jgi:type III restriction enzyme
LRNWLLAAGLDEPEIAIKTADTNDLANPENLDLLSSTNRVRAIITKQALQEGWDCPFAYVLCSLAASVTANSGSNSAFWSKSFASGSTASATEWPRRTFAPR